MIILLSNEQNKGEECNQILETVMQNEFKTQTKSQNE